MHIRNNNVDWKSILQILCGAAPALLITSSGIVALGENPKTGTIINQIVEYLIISVIVFSIITMIRRSSSEAVQQISTNQENFSFKIVAAGATTGMIMGATGVGGGVLLLPLLSTQLGLTMKKSVGSAVVIALVLSATSALTYGKGGQSDMLTALLLVTGSFIGIPLAAFL